MLSPHVIDASDRSRHDFGPCGPVLSGTTQQAMDEQTFEKDLDSGVETAWSLTFDF